MISKDSGILITLRLIIIFKAPLDLLFIDVSTGFINCPFLGDRTEFCVPFRNVTVRNVTVTPHGFLLHTRTALCRDE